MLTFLESPLGLALMLALVILGVLAVLALALCVVARWADAEIQRSERNK